MATTKELEEIAKRMAAIRRDSKALGLTTFQLVVASPDDDDENAFVRMLIGGNPEAMIRAFAAAIRSNDDFARIICRALPLAVSMPELTVEQLDLKEWKRKK